jgi:FtsP/CotA-like multicopper oxidase with cupredoxin domain
MTRNTRLALVAAVVAIAVVAFVIAKPGGDDEQAADNAAQPTQTAETTPGDGETETEQPTASQPEPAVTRIAIKGGKLVGGVKTIAVQKGDPVRIVVTADAPDELHLHGFDIEKTAEPGKPARFNFKANLEGEFVLESHTLEHAGVDPALARVRVEPS